MYVELQNGIIHELIQNAHSVCGVDLYIADLNFKIIAPLNDAADILQNGLDAHPEYRTRDYSNVTEPPTNAVIYKYISNGLPLCYFIVQGERSRFAVHYVKTLADIILSKQHQDRQDSSDSRGMLINQLSNIGKESYELDLLIKDFRYSRSCSRCAILFEMAKKHGDSEVQRNFSDSLFETAVRQSSNVLSNEDIYGLLTPQRYLIYKDVSSVCEDETASYLHKFTHSVMAAVTELLGCECRAGIGSVYSEIFDLRCSYLEASFLLSNFEYLSVEHEIPILSIDRYIFDYLTNSINIKYWQTRFDMFSNALGGNDTLLRTATELSRHNLNLSETAKMCNVHRNTLLQRFSKLKDMTGLSPSGNDRDRMLLRVFTLRQNRKITLRVGIVIQPNSVLHQGMQKLAAIVEHNSDGRLKLDIHTLSVSGNNAMLFETTRSGALDMIVAATGVMNKFTEGLTSLIDFPFLFATNEEAMFVLNSAFLDGIEDSMKRIGIKCLNIWSMGWRYITSRTPIYTPSDMAGKRIRIMSTKSIYEYFKSMDALPIHIDYGKVKEALHTGVIDCEENPYNNILGMRFYEEQSYITRLKYYLDTEGLYMCRNTWNSLNQSHREMLSVAAKEATEWIFNEQHYVINQEAKNSLLREHNMKILEISEEQKSLWEEYSKPLYSAYPHKSFLHKIMEVRNEFRQ